MKKIIVDIDGTISLPGASRRHLIPSAQMRHITAAWSEYNLASHADLPIVKTINLINDLSQSHEIILLTSRGEAAREVTINWLKKHGVIYHQLIMRENDNNSHQMFFKEDKLIEIGLDNILCCFDDDSHVIGGMRRLGLTAYQAG